MKSHVQRRLLASATWTALISSLAQAQPYECYTGTGPDLICGKIVGFTQWGSVGGVTGYSFGTMACNIGTDNLWWHGLSNQHPVVAMNVYRLRDGRFEQIGMSWAKHSIKSAADNECCVCNNPGTTTLLGVGCSDVYGSVVNGNQAGTVSGGGLGPRSDINPWTGEFNYPYSTQGQSGNDIYKRIQISNADLNPAMNPGALYFAEAVFVAPDDSASGNQLNNAAYAPVDVGSFNSGGWELIVQANNSVPLSPAIFAWKAHHPDVMIDSVRASNDGLFYLGSRATPNGNGTWTYEYALFNKNSHRAAGAFAISIPDGVNVSNVDFRDINNHSGEIYSNADWEWTHGGGELTWSTQSYQANPNANALRWGTMYNFRFVANTPPASSQAQIHLFLPGSPSHLTVQAVSPSGDGSGGTPGPGCDGATVVDLGSTAFSNSNSDPDGPALDCAANTGHSVWFKYRSTFTGQLRITTCDNLNFNTALAVYEGCNCSNLNPIACDDNGGNCGGGSRIDLNVTAGTCYLIQIAGVNGATGSGTLKLTCTDRNNAVRANRVYSGTVSHGQLGFAIGGAHRVGGGTGDKVAIGAFNDKQPGTGAGRVFVSLDQPMFEFEPIPGAAGDGFGRAVACGCDVDGDDQDDVIIGAPFNSDSGSKSGKVYAYAGSSRELIWSVNGEAAGDRMGWAVACAGDLNGDGMADVLVGAPFNDHAGTNAGKVYVLSGQNGSLIQQIKGKAAGDLFGSALTGLGRLNGDNTPDYAVGAPNHDHSGTNAGKVYVFSGSNHRVLQTMTGGSDGARFGYALAGRTFGTGTAARTVLAVGAPQHRRNESNVGQVRVYIRTHGNPGCNKLLCGDFSITGERAGDRFGTSVAVCNLTSDNTPDIVVGAPLASVAGARRGAAYVINGANRNLVRRVYGEAAGDRFGRSVAIAGDINGDGLNDWMAGAPTNDARRKNGGRAYAFISRNNSSGVRSLVVIENAEGTELGDDVHDLNQDGRVDSGDLMMALESIGSCRTDENCSADVAPPGGDAVVDGRDVLAILNAWHR